MRKARKLPSADQFRLGAIFSALADQHRWTVVKQLAAAPAGTRRSCSSFGVKVTKATMSHHFRVLREAGLIAQYSSELELRRADIDATFPGLLALIADCDNHDLGEPDPRW